MLFSDLEKAALRLNELYEQLEVKQYGRVWTTEELTLGFVGDVGDLAKLIQAHAGVRDIDDCHGACVPGQAPDADLRAPR